MNCLPSPFRQLIPVCALFVAAGHLGAQPATKPATLPTTDDDAKKAWSTVVIMSRPAMPDTPPGVTKSAHTRELERRNVATAYVNASDQARDFYTKHSSDPNAKEAKKLEVTNLLRAVESGDKAQKAKADQLGKTFREDKEQPVANRLEVAVLMNHLRVRETVPNKPKLALEEYEKSARGLMGEFSNVPDAYDFFWGVARNSPPAKAREMAGELLMLPAPERVKIEARRLLERFAMVGKPAALNFTAEDGTAFDFQKQKGKTTVIYIWGNISQGSLAALPKIKSAVTPAINFIGVNIDNDVAAAKATARRESLPGTQV